jgi:putative ABC transport system permease protein
MNPAPVLRAQIKSAPTSFVLIVLLIAVAVGLGVAASVLERSLRDGSARAADSFDLLVAAPGSQAQVVLTSVFLQAGAIPLIPGNTLEKLRRENGVVYAAPIGFGDRLGRHPIVGSSTDLLTLGGRRALREGRVFQTDHEAVVGASVPMKLGEEFAAQHGMASAGADDDDEAGEEDHAHGAFKYSIVGRMAPTGTPWDQAIVVPIEAVWQVHGFNNGHEAGVTRIGPPWESADAPGVPAIVVKPRTVGDAYRLRAKYRTDGTMALFPAEVLVEIYAAAGIARDVLTLVATITQILVVCAVILAITASLEGQRQRLAVLRALGASRLYLLTSIWLYAGLMVVIGAALGLAVGWGLAQGVAVWLSERTATALTVNLDQTDIWLLGILLLVGLAGALIPAWRAYSQPVSPALRA